jgi:hypothetical protein
MAAQAALVASCLAGAPALACEGEVLFEDDFSAAKPGWPQSEGVAVENGRLVMTVEANQAATLVSEAGQYAKFELCAELRQEVSDPRTGWGGLVFWAADDNNYFLFEVATNGYAALSQKSYGTWFHGLVVKSTQGVVKPGPLPNRLRVVTGTSSLFPMARFFVNDTEVFTYVSRNTTGSPKKIGVAGNAPKDRKALFRFDDIKVTKAP